MSSALNRLWKSPPHTPQGHKDAILDRHRRPVWSGPANRQAENEHARYTTSARIVDERFETTIRETVAAIGGVLLFQMKLQEEDGDHWTAAVAVGEPGSLEIIIIDLPCGADGADVSVRPVAESALPIAAIAPAYAGLAECWPKAA